MDFWDADEPILKALPYDPLRGIEGWLGFFAFQIAANILYLIWITVHLRRLDYILLNLLSLSVGSLLLLTLFRRSVLFFPALYANFVLRIGFPLYPAWKHWRFVHTRGYSLDGPASYETLFFAVAFVALWIAYFKLSHRVLVTFGRNL